MSVVVDGLNAIGKWILINLHNIILSVLFVIGGFFVHKVVTRQIERLKDRKRLDEGLSYTFARMVNWGIGLVVVSAILGQFGVTTAAISGFVAIFGGTILGFASINTIGNAISGLIVMINRPLMVGDRIYFKGQFADVEGVELIYTKMRTLDNVLVSIPNQELLKVEVVNFGKNNIIRREVTVTTDFESNSSDVEQALLDAAENVDQVLRQPKPYVRITKFLNYAVEYKLYVFIRQVKRIAEIDAQLYRSVLDTCKRHMIDISTPILTKQIQEHKLLNQQTKMSHYFPLPPEHPSVTSQYQRSS